jgi:hypothetical protein
MTIHITDDRFRHLVQLANASALDQRKWSWFLEELSTASGGIRVQLFTQDPQAQYSLGILEHGYDPAFLGSYESYYAALNPWVPMLQSIQPGRVVSSEDLLPLSDLEKTEFYHDWVRPQDDIVGGVGALLERRGERLSMIGGNIARRDRDRLERPFVNLLQRLTPFVQHSLKVARMLGELTIENRVMREGMEPDLTAVFALDGRGRVHFANRSGEKLLRSGDVIQRDASARLRFADATAQAALGRALHDHFLPEMTVSLPFFAGARKRGQFLCRTMPVSECDGPLPWLTGSGSHATGFVLLFLAGVAPSTRPVPRQPTIG